MNFKKTVSLFLLSFLIVGSGCHAEGSQSSNPPVSSIDPTVVATPVTAQATGPWYEGWYQGAEGYDKAVEEFKRTHQPMLVYMSVAWCPYCRKFEKEVLSSPGVRDFLKDKIKVTLNPETGPRENAIAFQYGIRGFPSLFLHPPQPAQALQFPTNVTPEEFVQLFRQAVQ